jgi:flagellar basal-body rod modification protein FlgD
MSAIDALGASRNTGASQSNAFASLSSEDFTKVILQELTRQDPLQPNDTNALIQQLAGIRSIQSNMDLSNRLDALVSQNEFASASTLIGKSVSGISVDNARVSGTVKSVGRSSYGAVVTLEDNTMMLVSNLDQITVPPAAAQGAS